MKGRDNEFEFWYAAGRDYAATGKEHGVTERTVYSWAERWFWRERADCRDEGAREIADRAAAREQAEVLIAVRRRHKQIGAALQQRGLTYLQANPIINSQNPDNTALSFIREGIKIELTAEQIPSELIEILKLTDEELLRRYAEMDSNPNEGGSS